MARLDPEQQREAVLDERFAALAQARTDLATVSTWDPHLIRRTRILVPADVLYLRCSPELTTKPRNPWRCPGCRTAGWWCARCSQPVSGRRACAAG